MKMWFLNIVILLFFCCDSSACLSTGNATVQFVSKNFYNVLHWDPAEPDFPGERLLYSVTYKSDDEAPPYKIKEDCQNITNLYCDLTAETPYVQDVYYHAKVLVNGRPHGLTVTRFKPSEHTIFGPPTLFTSTTELTLFVNVTLPLGPNGVSIADIINSRNVALKNIFIYTLSLHYPESAEQTYENQTGHFYISLQKSGNYCGTVIYQPSVHWGRPSSEMASFCVTLSGLSDSPRKALDGWILMIVAVLVALVIVSVVCACKYVKGGKPKLMTQELVTTFGSPKILQEPDKNLIISPVEVCPQRDEIFYAKIQMNTDGPSVKSGGYSPQDISCFDTSIQSSDNYGAVAVQVPPEENEVVQQAATEHREASHPPVSGRMSPKLTSHDAPLLPDGDTCDSNPAGKLLLHTVRDISGKLVLPLISFQLQSSNGETVSPAYPERKPLLSDLIDSKDESSLASLASLDSSEWSDSGCDYSSLTTPIHLYCNTHSSPSQPVVSDSDEGCQSTPSSDDTFEAAYKQNWMPEFFCERSGIDSCIRTNYMWTCTGSKMGEENEDVEDSGGVEQSKQIILGSWTLQIQE